jgi:hypothetical protein
VTKKSKSRRYGLSRQHTRKSARPFVDMDYVDKLPPEARAWLERFSREYYQCNIRKGEDNLHASDELRRDCYSTNNARFRDAWNNFTRMPLDLTDYMAAEEEKE